MQFGAAGYLPRRYAVKMKMNKRKIFIAIFTIGLVLIFLYQNRIKFEYFAWNLSSENYYTREESIKKIIAMGNVAIPFIINRLDHPYIFETDYLIKVLEKNEKVKFDYKNQKEAIIFWKKWWKLNSSNFNNN